VIKFNPELLSGPEGAGKVSGAGRRFLCEDERRERRQGKGRMRARMAGGMILIRYANV
jgi:hypothetical protein